MKLSFYLIKWNQIYSSLSSNSSKHLNSIGIVTSCFRFERSLNESHFCNFWILFCLMSSSLLFSTVIPPALFAATPGHISGQSSYQIFVLVHYKRIPSSWKPLAILLFHTPKDLTVLSILRKQKWGSLSNFLIFVLLCAVSSR